MDEQRDDWERVGTTLDWLAALLSTSLDRDPRDLVRPVVVLGLVSGLAAEALNLATGATEALVLVGVALTLFGYGMLVLLAVRFRSGSGDTPTAEADVLAPWLRRLQVLMVAALVLNVALLVFGAVRGSWLLVVRNTLEVGRVGGVVLALSLLLLDGEVGPPAWLAGWSRDPAPARE